MSYDTNMLQHLIRFVKGTVADVVGRESGPAFKFAFDIVYGILKSSSVVLDGIGLALVEKSSLKAVNNRLYPNLIKGFPDAHWSNCHRQGIAHKLIRPRMPEHNGKVERMLGIR